MDTAAQVIARLGLRPHPEGGHYVETYRAPAEAGGRGACTAIYYLLARGERSHWHEVDAVEIWHHYAGAPLALSLSEDGRGERRIVLGPDLAAGQSPQAVVPPHAWQAAESLGEWSLVGCTVSPAFQFDGFTLAPPGWRPGQPDPRSES
jgi:predicted cupin superfamily sugar epimerase